MISSIEKILFNSSIRDIYLKIKQKSNELGLPCNVGEKIVGFGKFDDFYMYWINVKDGELLFTARINYTKSKNSENLVRIPLMVDFEDKIFNGINVIYNNFIVTANGAERLQRAGEQEDNVFNDAKDASHIINENEYNGIFESETDILEKKLSETIERLSECLKSNEDKSIGYIYDTRVRNLFAKCRIENYGDILKYTASQIRKWKNCGNKCLENIINLINAFLCTNGIEVKSVHNIDEAVFYDEFRLQKIIEENKWQEHIVSSDEMEKFSCAAIEIKQSLEQALNVSVALNYDGASVLWFSADFRKVLKEVAIEVISHDCQIALLGANALECENR